MARIAVYVNIYDMYWLNEYASNIGVGVYHSGVEIYGIEYAYGGHPLPFSGIFENTPRDANELGENFKFRESILIGETDFSAADVKRMIQLMGEEYRGDRYHLILKNCNHFTAALSKTLTGNDIPPWVNRLATISGSIPFLERWIPAEWLTPIALQQSLDDKSKMRGTTTRQSQYTDPSTSTVNGTAVPPAFSSVSNPASRKCSQRQASSSSILSNSSDSATRSEPNTARTSVNSAALGVASQASSQSLAKLWNSIKNIASSATESCSPALSATSLKKSFDQSLSHQLPSSVTKSDKTPSNNTSRPSDC